MPHEVGARMIGRHSARHGLEPIAADGKAVRGQPRHDVGQPGARPLRVDRLAVPGDLISGLAVISPARLQPGAGYLQVEPEAWDTLRERALVGLVGRLVGGEPGVALGPVDSEGSELRL